MRILKVQILLLIAPRFNPIVDWLPLVPESLKPKLKDAIANGLKSAIFSLIETAIDDLESIDNKTKKTLKEAAKAGFSLKNPSVSTSTVESTSTGSTQNNNSTTPHAGPEERKPFEAPD